MKRYGPIIFFSFLIGLAGLHAKSQPPLYAVSHAQGDAATAQNGAVSVEAPEPNHVPIFHVTVVARTIPAVNYRHRGGTTKVDFRGTALMPAAMGDAEIKTEQGAVKVDARFKHLQPASGFGPEYMTYVLWAITPEGRPLNLGEILPNGGGNSELFATSNLQSFGLIVTAEPYFSVTRPSDVVVMQNFITDKTNGTIEEVEAKYELLKRGQYTHNVGPAELTPLPVYPKAPLEIYEAQNAVRIAKWAGAGKYAPDSLSKAETDLGNAQAFINGKGSIKEAITDAREAAQMAEDARVTTIRKMEAEEQASVRESATEAMMKAQDAAAEAARARARAVQAQDEKAAADAQKRAAESQANQAQAEAANAKLAAQHAQVQASQAEVEKARLRAQLEQQLNSILQTRDTARGLIMNMSDVLFDTGKYTLKPIAREKLAKVSGILVAHPGLTLEIDGYTDNVGGDEYNQRLSEERAMAVRDYLATQGVPATSIEAKGFGKTNPVAPNDTASGRQQNRRVELVVSGAAIRAQLNMMDKP